MSAQTVNGLHLVDPSVVNGNGAYRGRAALTDSNLVNPESPIHCLAAQFQTYLHMPDPMPLYVTMGSVAGMMLTGTPPWLMLVGSSGCGKTAMLESLLKVQGVEPVSDISGDGALLSGTKRKEVAKDATGGLLKVLGENGCLAFMDFTSILSKSKERVSDLLGIFRELFDRTWSRDIGGEGGRKLVHTGRVCLIAGVTQAVDRAHEVNREMGERCLYFRYPTTDGYQEGRTALDDVEPDKSKEHRQLLVEAMFEHCGLSFAQPVRRRQLTMREQHRIVTLAQFGARCRSNVPRDAYTHQVIDAVSPEVATRMAKEMAQLYCGMEAIGNTQEETWAALRKVALDSMSMARRTVLEHVQVGEETERAIATAAKISQRVVKIVLEDLELLGVLEKRGAKGAEKWRASEWTDRKLSEA